MHHKLEIEKQNYLVHSLIDDDQTLQLYLYDTFNLKGNDLTSISGVNVDVYINEDKEFNFIDNSLIKNRLYNVRLDSSSFTISEYELINNRLVPNPIECRSSIGQYIRQSNTYNL